MKKSLQNMNRSVKTVAKSLALTAVLASGMALAPATQAQEAIGDPIWVVEGFGPEAWFSGFGNQVRGIALNPATGNLLVPSRADGIRVEQLNPENGVSLGSLNTDGISGGILPLNRIAVTDDGQIFATNLILDSGTDFTIWYWSDENADPVALFVGNPTPNKRYGDGIGVAGSGDNIELYVSGTFTDNIAVFSFDGEELNQTPRVISIPQDAANASIVRIPDTDYAWINGRDQIARKINMETGDVVASISLEILPRSYGDIDYIASNGREFLLAGIAGVEDNNFLLLDVSDDTNPVVIAETGSIGLGENSFRTAGVSIDSENQIAYVLATNVAVAAYDISDALQISVSIEHDSTTPQAFVLQQNYPNPFNPTTNIEFSLPNAEHVQLNVYNMLGQQVATVVNEVRGAGSHTVRFDASGLGSGVYIYRLQAGENIANMRMTLVK